MARFTNQSSVPLSLAVFLATDHYDYDDTAISATALLKPLRQAILAQRVPPEQQSIDILEMMASRLGTAIHDGIERAWLLKYAEALKSLGLPDRVINRIKINPDPSTVTGDDIPVYLEQRIKRDFMGVTISGKFDFVAEGRVEDFKTTSVFTWMNNTNDEKHAWQGSIYRWLAPHLITQDEMAIQYIFTDWSAAQARINPKYPQQRTVQRILPLKSMAEVERFISQKLQLLDQYKNAPESTLPFCTDADLWRREPVFKYYKNPTKTDGRSTKNFDTYREAHLRLIEDGSVGVIKEVPGQVTACKYCPAFSVCTQKDVLIASGDLVL